ncbi:MAG: hypothetical protein R2716_09530 [Microthrixaceae bacterium]
MLVALVVLLAMLVVAVLWFFLGRDRAEQLSQDDALADFRAAGAEPVASEGLPEAGVYEASASGTESIGLPGFDEDLGPSAPVTVTYGEEGCFTYRADFNSHHWRSWTFCPEQGAEFALVRLDSWTARRAPALEVETLSTYTCEVPLAFLWSAMSPGETRSSECTGTMDTDDSVTLDDGSVEVLPSESLEVGGTELEATRIRTSDEFSGDQSGFEHGDWWLDPETGLPLRVGIEARLEGGPTTYTESFDLRLDTLEPAT